MEGLSSKLSLSGVGPAQPCAHAGSGQRIPLDLQGATGETHKAVQKLVIRAVRVHSRKVFA